MQEWGYKSLIGWHKSMQLTKLIYDLSEVWPASENFGLKSQIRRASISVSSNIAEGSARSSVADRKRFYGIARSAVIEVNSQLELSLMLKYTGFDQFEPINNIMIEIFKMLTKMIL